MNDPLGSQRDWVWRGWQVRYTFIRTDNPDKSIPLLFLHGFGSALTQWQENLVPLSQAHSVYALDLVGFGASEKAIAPYKVGFWVEQVYEFWRTFIHQPIGLIGHSLGALVALAAAVKHPEMISNLVLMTLPAARQELLSGKFQAWVGEIESLFASPLLIKLLFQVIRRPRVIRAVLRSSYVNKDRVTETLVESFILPGRDRGAAEVLYRLTKARTQNDFTPMTKTLLPQVQRPVLLLWGIEDRIIPLKWGRQLPVLNPRLRFVEIPHGGHFIYDECAIEVNQKILRWLAEHQDYGNG
jgi:pimeloyl-ACP methyl ester carboxylesterase